MGMEQKTTSDQTVKYRYDIEKVQPNGAIDLKMTIASMTTKQITPMATVSYNSEKPDESQPKEYATSFKNLIGTTFDVSLSPKGNVTQIKGGENMFEGMFDDMGDQAKMMEDQMNSQFGSKAMAQSFSQITGFYPNKSVSVGDTWAKTDTVQVGMEILVHSTFTLKERKDGKATILVNSTLQTNPSFPGMEMMGMTMKYDLAGTQDGTIVVDEKSGWTLNSDLAQKMKGKINMTGGPVGQMTADMALVGKNSITQTKQ